MTVDTLLTTICDAPVDGKNYIQIQLKKSNSIGQHLRSCIIVAVFLGKNGKLFHTPVWLMRLATFA
jgi:hypothetical protein